MGLLPMEADILPPSDDRVFKLILTSPEAKPVLIDLVSSIIKRPVVDVVVRNNEIPPEDTQEKAERLDVNCYIDDNSQVDLEMQASRIEEDSDGQHRNLKGKSVYYLCDLHSSQPAKGIRRYDTLARTYQVTFCSYTVFPERKSYLNSFSLRHDEDSEQLCNAIQVVYVELSKLREIIKNLLMSISQDERERAVFRSRRMYQTDQQSNIATAEDRGVQRGRAEGRVERNIEIARQALQMKMSAADIAKLTGLTYEEVERLRIEEGGQV